ncbi:hypothetical protein [Melittangium boletus]|nr:hypothetical protein [Melittangium boletus]
MKFTNVLVVLLMVPLMGADTCVGEEDGPDGGSPPPVAPVEPKCSPRSCESGCCLGDICYQNETSTTCGSFGVQCEMCVGIESCQKKDETKGWECLDETTRLWMVQPELAVLPLLDPSDQSAWDADNSDPDVVVTLSCPSGGSVTDVQTSEVSSYTPKWADGACVTTVEDLKRVPLAISVVDVDAFLDDPIASLSYSFKDEDFSKGWIEIPIFQDGASKLRLRLVRSP